MFIEYNDGKSGIVEYLETGQKKGRETTREEMDHRVTLVGNINDLDSILNRTEKGYKHITISFKEDNISEQEMKDALDEYLKFLMSACEKDEYYAYAEIHYPKIKSYTDKETGEVKFRKPHIHLVIPKTNMKTHELLQPGGFVKSNIEFLDSFQEKYNLENDYSSPKDNRSNTFGLFEKNKELKTEILEKIIANDIKSFDELHELLKAEYSNVHHANKNKPLQEYLAVQQPHHEKRTRLKDYVFTRDFFEKYKTREEKIKFIEDKSIEAYIEKKPHQDKKKLENYNKQLKYWREVRSREIKYLDNNTKYYKEVYSKLTTEERIQELNKIERQYYINNDIESQIDKDLKDFQIDTNLKILVKNNKNEYSASVAASKIVAAVEFEKIEKIDFSKLDATTLFYHLKNEKGVRDEKYSIENNMIKAGSRLLSIKEMLVDEMRLNSSEINQIKENIMTLENFKNRVKEEYQDRKIMTIRGTERDYNVSINEDGMLYDLESQELFKDRQQELIWKQLVEQQNKLKIREELSAEDLLKNLKKYNVELQADEIKVNKELNTLTIKKGDEEIEYTPVAVLDEYREKMSDQIEALEKQTRMLQIRLKDNQLVDSAQVEVNLLADENRLVQYAQAVTRDAAGRQSGIIYDGASNAMVFLKDDQVIDEEEFKKLYRYDAYVQKMNEIAITKQTPVYSKELKCQILKTEMTLTDEGVGHLRSKYNFDKLKPIEIGDTKFKNAKRLDKNLFTLAKEAIILKYDQVKRDLQAYFSSKKDLSENNLRLAEKVYQLEKQLNQKMTSQQILQLKNEELQKSNQELQNSNHELKIDLSIEKKHQEKQKESEKGFGALLEKVHDAKDKIEKAQDLVDVVEKLNNNEEYKQKAVELFNRVIEKPELVSDFSSNDFRRLDVKDSEILSTLLDNDVKLSSFDQFREITKAFEQAVEISADQGLDAEKMIENMIRQIKELTNEKQNNNEYERD